MSAAGPAVRVTLWTDPACPFAFSAEPARLAVRWRYGERLAFTPRMIVLTRESGEAEKLATGGAGLQRRYGMPIAPRPYPRPASSEPACLAVVAVREHPEGGVGAAERLLRALRVRVMDGGLLDDDALIDAACADAGLDAATVRRWMGSPAAVEALEADAAGARAPSAAARALDHKLGGPPGERRYTAPSWVLSAADDSHAPELAVPGFNPTAVYEAAIANLAPELERRPVPASVSELLAWAPAPLATAEVVEITGLPEAEARDALGRCAVATPAGADMYWSVPKP